MYSLNTEKIMEMVKGNLMPQHVQLLSSVISILYVSAHKLPKEPLKNLLQVHRGKVYGVLLWLKSNNPKYFTNIEISQECLALLPLDNVLTEIMEVVRRTDDESIIESENGGYVPTEEDLEEFMTVTNCCEGVEDNRGEFSFFCVFWHL